MTPVLDPQRFVQAPLLGRAIMLLRGSFRDPHEPVSRINVADGIANAVARPNTAGVAGGQIMGRGNPDPEIYRLVSEAWQVLEHARLICRAIDQTTRSGDWWILTQAGLGARDSTDPEGVIRLALQGH